MNVLVYKTFWGAYLDFDQLFCISPPFVNVIERIAGFTLISSDPINKEIIYSRELTDDEGTFAFGINSDNSLYRDYLGDKPRPEGLVYYYTHGTYFFKTIENTWIDKYGFPNINNLLVFHNIQKQIDELVNDWNNYKIEKSKHSLLKTI